MYLQYIALACTAAVSSDLLYNWLTPLIVRKHKYVHVHVHQKLMFRYSIAFYLYLELCHQHLDSQALIYIVHVYESSVGPSSTTNPKPRGKPSHCLLRQTYMYVNPAKGRATYM